MKIIAHLGYEAAGKGIVPALCHYCYMEWKSQRAPGRALYTDWMREQPYEPCVLLDSEWACVACLAKLVAEMDAL